MPSSVRLKSATVYLGIINKSLGWRDQGLSEMGVAIKNIKMAQRVRALTALPKVLSSNPSDHMVAHVHL